MERFQHTQSSEDIGQCVSSPSLSLSLPPSLHAANHCYGRLSHDDRDYDVGAGGWGILLELYVAWCNEDVILSVSSCVSFNICLLRMNKKGILQAQRTSGDELLRVASMWVGKVSSGSVIDAAWCKCRCCTLPLQPKPTHMLAFARSGHIYWEGGWWLCLQSVDKNTVHTMGKEVDNIF